MHVESVTKNKMGIEITRKTKRIGCSGIKDLLEEGKLEIHDENTIMEISTFIAKGVSYEASDNNHDDLMMNLVMFGYFATGTYFNDITDINMKEMLFNQKMQEIDDDLVPFGFHDDGSDLIDLLESQEEMKDKGWSIPFESEW